MSTDVNRAATTSARVVVATTVALSFISFWRGASIVLSDLASSAFYAGGIAEVAVGPAAPWFVLGVMLFSFAVRSVYMESCSMFVRGGVYIVVKDSMGPFMARMSVSALVFDYILTGPISVVSAGQYLGHLLDEIAKMLGQSFPFDVNHFAALFAVAITIYFWWTNIKGLHESSGKALRIMQITTIMVVAFLIWCPLTILLRGRIETPPPPLPRNLQFGPTALGWFQGTIWPSIPIVALIIAFGHSILSMSGFETLAQVYREIGYPKMKNLRITANIVCWYAVICTGVITVFASLIINSNDIRSLYSDNLLGGLAMRLAGPELLKLLFHVFVVVVGILILSGAVNTAIIGANGVLNRVAEDGVLLDWFRKPHRRFGTTHRIINSIVLLQLATIIASRGDIQVILRPAENDPVSLLTKRVRPPFNEVEEELKRDGKESVRRKYRRRPLRAVMKEVEEEIEEHFSEHQLKKEAIQIMEDELNDLSGSNRPVEVKLFGPDYKKLRELAEEVSETLEKKGKGRGIKEVNSNVFAGNPDLMIDVDRLAAERVGLTAMDIERQLRAMYLGQVATQVRESALRITDVRVRYPNDLRFGRGRFDLDLLRRQWLLLPPLAAGNGTASNGSAGSAYQGPAALARAVPVSAVARVVPVRTPDEQTRENQQPAQIVTADLNESEAGLGSVVADIRRWMGELSEKGKIPPGYRWEVGGHYVRQQEAFRSLAVVMVVAILLVFILLAFQFRSVALPLLIFLTQPLSLVSGLFALWLTGTPLNVSSYMGTILLIGLDMKNGILLVEYIQQLRAEGVGLHEALLLAGRTRFRPILMTSLAAILGLFPLALGIGPGAQMQQPLAIMVIGGLTANMLFTRMIIPVGYLLLERGKAPAEAPKVAADPAPGAAG